MSGDALVYDFANTTDSQSSVFLKKDWLSIIDDNTTNYAGNQVTINTSAISNSNRYCDYRQGYLQIPLLYTLTGTVTHAANGLMPATAAKSADYALGLKNWVGGSVIHNLTCEINGTSVIQQTNLLPLYNQFKLLTTLSHSDYAIFSSIGFAKDEALSVRFHVANNADGKGICNNQNALAFPTVTAKHNSYLTGNEGFTRRQMFFNFDLDGIVGDTANTFGTATNGLISEAYARQLYKSHIITKINSTAGGQKGIFQQAINVTCHLRHLSSFFDAMPLLKGTFMKLILGVSNSSVSFTVASSVITATTVTNSLGGLNPIMLASCATANGNKTLPDDTYIASLSVGAKCLNTTQLGISGVTQGTMAQSVSLNVPSYVFSPNIEMAFLKSPVKKINYTDLYQFTIQNVASSSQINALVSNGIKNLKKIIVMPLLNATGNKGLHQLQSPYCSGVLAPYAHIGQFNVVISGANVFQNAQRYTYESFLHQLYGINSINSGLTSGMSSGLISQQDFESGYPYYIADVSRMLDIERDVPKSVTITGQNLSLQEVDYIVFCEYGAEVSFDVLTGSRVA